MRIAVALAGFALVLSSAACEKKCADGEEKDKKEDKCVPKASVISATTSTNSSSATATVTAASTSTAGAPAGTAPVAPPAVEAFPPPDTAFTRAPLVVRIKQASGAEHIVITAHLPPDRAVTEAGWLDDVYEHEAARSGIESAILLGDLNLGCDYASAAEIAALDLRKDDRFKWLVDDDADTNSSVATKCAYDRIVVAGEAASDAALVTTISLGDGVSDHKAVYGRAGSLMFATLNTQRFGKTRAESAEIVKALAGPPCAVGLVVLQEIVGEDAEDAVALIASAAKEKCGRNVNALVSDATGTSDYTERYAVLYDSDLVELVEAHLFAVNGVAAPATAAPPGADPAVCGVDPHKTPGGYCYATFPEKMKRVSLSCCSE